MFRKTGKSSSGKEEHPPFQPAVTLLWPGPTLARLILAMTCFEPQGSDQFGPWKKKMKKKNAGKSNSSLPLMERCTMESQMTRLCRQPESEPIVCHVYWELLVVVVSPHACFRALPFARFPCLFAWTRDPKLMSQHGCHFRFDGS